MPSDYAVLAAIARDPLEPLFPVRSFVPASPCPHFGPLRRGSRLCCMCCDRSGRDHLRDHMPGRIARGGEVEQDAEPSPSHQPTKHQLSDRSYIRLSRDREAKEWLDKTGVEIVPVEPRRSRRRGVGVAR